MNSDRELFFYEISRFQELKNHYDRQGKTIRSISSFIANDGQEPEQLGLYEVIDISSLSNLDRIQYIAERTIDKFDDTFTFIANIKHKDKFIQELRFCFNNFTELEGFCANENETSIVSLSYRKKVTDLDVKGLNEFFQKIDGELYGHEKFKDDFKSLVTNFTVFNRLGEHKILSLFLLGDSGVGKTEVARAIHKALDGKSKMAKINFGNYSSDNSLNSLIGSPRGYIGSEDGEIFIRVSESDTGIILIDEFEKSNSTLFNYFLDVLENGKMVSSLAHEIDLNGFIIIFTSNISKENFANVISPELRSRLDYKGYFSFLKAKDKSKYVEFRTDSIIEKFNVLESNVLGIGFRNEIIEQIDVRKYKNMRDLNKEIRRVFVKTLLSTIKQ